MKKIIFILILLSISCSTVFADDFMIQGTFINTSRKHKTDSSNLHLDFNTLGINLQSFKSRNDFFGFMSTFSFVIPVSGRSKVDGVESDADPLEFYDAFNWGIDSIIGPGFKLGPGAFKVLLGGGFHVDMLALSNKELAGTVFGSMLTLSMGLGLDTTVLFYLTDGFNLNLGLMAAYDFFEISTLSSLDETSQFSGGLTYGITAGLGFTY